MPSGRLDDEEKEMILQMVDEGLSLRDIAFKTGRDVKIISRLKAKFHPSTKLARRYIKAKAMVLAERVIKHAKVAEAIDVLSRPDIDVLKPQQRGDIQGNIFVFGGADTLGGVIEATRPPQKFIEGEIHAVPVGEARALPVGESSGYSETLDTGTREPAAQVGARGGKGAPGRGSVPPDQKASGPLATTIGGVTGVAHPLPVLGRKPPSRAHGSKRSKINLRYDIVEEDDE